MTFISTNQKGDATNKGSYDVFEINEIIPNQGTNYKHIKTRD